jgi:hypothetical protein
VQLGQLLSCWIYHCCWNTLSIWILLQQQGCKCMSCWILLSIRRFFRRNYSPCMPYRIILPRRIHTGNYMQIWNLLSRLFIYTNTVRSRIRVFQPFLADSVPDKHRVLLPSRNVDGHHHMLTRLLLPQHDHSNPLLDWIVLSHSHDDRQRLPSWIVLPYAQQCLFVSSWHVLSTEIHHSCAMRCWILLQHDKISNTV